MNSNLAKALAQHKEWLHKMNYSVENARNEGLRRAVTFAEGEAKKNAMERIYRQPIPKLKNGKDAYKRTGLYKATIKAHVDANGKGYLISPVAYAKKLEYFHKKMCLSDAVFNNKIAITRLISNEIKKVTRTSRGV